MWAIIPSRLSTMVSRARTVTLAAPTRRAVLHDDDVAGADRLQPRGRLGLPRRAAADHPTYFEKAVGVDDVVVELLVAGVDDERDVVDEVEVLVRLEDVGEDRLPHQLHELLGDEAAGEPAAAAGCEHNGAHAAGCACCAPWGACCGCGSRSDICAHTCDTSQRSCCRRGMAPRRNT